MIVPKILTFRSFLEKFYTEIYYEYNKKDGEIFKAIENSSTFGTKIKNEAGKNEPGKMILDRALRGDPGIRQAVWSHFKFGNEIKYPLLPNDFVYGALSYMVHNPDYRTLLVSDAAPPEFSAFYKSLAELFQAKFEQFSAVDAFAGKELEINK
jgi:hypothetical protein